jgi:hypothetical protein
VSPGIPTIYVQYNDNCTFTMSVDPGTAITATSPPGPTLPPGNYQIQVLMVNPTGGYSCGTPVFTLRGPGVNSVTTFPNESLLDNHVLPALQPSSTYTAEDENAPAATHVYFTTAATGSSTSLLPSSTTSPASTRGSSQTDIVGSGLPPLRGRLVATVGAHGRTTITLSGRSVSRLKAGRYAVAVTDRSRTAGFQLEHSGGKPVDLTSARFVGHTTRTIALSGGRWTSSAGSFVVN